MKYTWKVVNTTIKDSNSLSKIVINCSWYKQGEDDNGNVARCYGTTRFESSQIDELSFIPFEELTEETVLNWVLASVSEAYDESLNNCIMTELQRTIYPEVTVMPPWEVSSIPEPDPVVTENTTEQPQTDNSETGE